MPLVFTYSSFFFSMDWKGLRLDRFCILRSRFVVLISSTFPVKFFSSESDNIA
uniref:Predicted protein n=1 Tax=Hordeum vulgare subsp. vulgare TaxID=112509 RepID=F2DBQ0_HORVV|nr:predicted protein [Hordeum vulgare subsp. vulgare]